MNPSDSVTEIGRDSLYWVLRYGVHDVFGSLPAVTLIFDLSTLQSNQHRYETKYICDQNWVKFASLVCEIWRSQCFCRFIACCDLDL